MENALITLGLAVVATCASFALALLASFLSLKMLLNTLKADS